VGFNAGQHFLPFRHRSLAASVTARAGFGTILALGNILDLPYCCNSVNDAQLTHTKQTHCTSRILQVPRRFWPPARAVQRLYHEQRIGRSAVSSHVPRGGLHTIPRRQVGTQQSLRRCRGGLIFRLRWNCCRRLRRRRPLHHLPLPTSFNAVITQRRQIWGNWSRRWPAHSIILFSTTLKRNGCNVSS